MSMHTDDHSASLVHCNDCNLDVVPSHAVRVGRGMVATCPRCSRIVDEPRGANEGVCHEDADDAADDAADGHVYPKEAQTIPAGRATSLSVILRGLKARRDEVVLKLSTMSELQTELNTLNRIIAAAEEP